MQLGEGSTAAPGGRWVAEIRMRFRGESSDQLPQLALVPCCAATWPLLLMQPTPSPSNLSCLQCIPDSKFGCLSKASCCTASRQCQKATEDARAGTCETVSCHCSLKWTVHSFLSCLTLWITAHAFSFFCSVQCIARDSFGCGAPDDCCNGSDKCQRRNAADAMGSCRSVRAACCTGLADSCCMRWV